MADQKLVTSSSKRSKRATDYTGIAALITAIATAVGLFINHNSQSENSKLVYDSMFAIMDYRLKVVEKACNVPTPTVNLMGMTLHEVKTDSIPEVGFRLPRFFARPKMVPSSYNQLQKIIQQTGRAWSPDSSTDTTTD